MEIGPGLGALTEPVGERLDALTVIELDRDLAARLQTHPFLGPKLTIYQQDAMTFDFASGGGERPAAARLRQPALQHLYTVDVPPFQLY